MQGEGLLQDLMLVLKKDKIMIRKIVYIILFVSLIALLVYLVSFFVSLKSVTRIKEEIKISQEIFYLKNEKRGLNYEITALSKSPRKKISYDDEDSFIYSSGETLFYKIKYDTLFIYTMHKAEYPKELKTNVVIEQIEIKNPDFIELKKTYKKRGLSIFPTN